MKLRFLLVSCLAMSLAVLAAGHVQEGSDKFEKPPEREALEVIPEWMVNGEYWTVADKVTNYDSLHEFTVHSKWGSFEVYGEPMLRIRLKELNAIGTLKQESTGEVAGKAALDGATKAVREVADVVTHPVETIKAAPKGILRMFKKIAYDVVEVGGDVVDVAGEVVKGEGKRAAEKAGEAGLKFGKRWLGIELQERLWAQGLGIDPYTTNLELRKELARVATIDAGAKFGVSLVNPLPSIGAISLLSTVYQVIWQKDHRELVEWIGVELAKMDVRLEVINALVYSEALPPGHLTLFVAALMQLEGVEQRKILAQQAVMLETEAEGLFFLECAVMAAWYHSTQAPLAKAVEGTLIPVFLTRESGLIAFSAADWAYWTELTAATAKEFSQVYTDYPERRELWVSDKVSRRFIDGMEGLGWKVRAGIRASVVPLIPWGLGNDITRSGIPEKK